MGKLRKKNRKDRQTGDADPTLGEAISVGASFTFTGANAGADHGDCCALTQPEPLSPAAALDAYLRALDELASRRRSMDLANRANRESADRARDAGDAFMAQTARVEAAELVLLEARQGIPRIFGGPITLHVIPGETD